MQRFTAHIPPVLFSRKRKPRPLRARFSRRAKAQLFRHAHGRGVLRRRLRFKRARAVFKRPAAERRRAFGRVAPSPISRADSIADLSASIRRKALKARVTDFRAVPQKHLPCGIPQPLSGICAASVEHFPVRRAQFRIGFPAGGRMRGHLRAAHRFQRQAFCYDSFHASPYRPIRQQTLVRPVLRRPSSASISFAAFT